MCVGIGNGTENKIGAKMLWFVKATQQKILSVGEQLVRVAATILGFEVENTKKVSKPLDFKSIRFFLSLLSLFLQNHCRITIRNM